MDNNNWISVEEEGVPENADDVLVYLAKQEHIGIGYCVNGTWIHKVPGTITHWMPLPSPPPQHLNK